MSTSRAVRGLATVVLSVLVVATGSMAAHAAGPVGVSADPSDEATPAEAPLPAALAQEPVPALRLPSDLADQGWTRLVRDPVLTTAGQTAHVSVSGIARQTGSTPSMPVPVKVARRDGALWVWLPGTLPTRVRVVITAPAAVGFDAFSVTRGYNTQAVG